MTIERYKVHDRDEWLALRAHDLTASDIGAAAGVDPYKSPLALYAEKIGMLMPQADNNAMRRGRWLEAAVLSAIRETHPTGTCARPSSTCATPSCAWAPRPTPSPRPTNQA
jgi:putative phage-type endonuclease